MKRIFLIGSIFAATLSFSQTDIEDARSYSVGQTVTVSGVVTNGSELGVIRYLQDGTAGIAAYGGSVGGINRYDSITVTGPLTEFSGLLEIGGSSNPVYINHGPAVVVPQPLEIPITAAGESLEGQYVVLNNLTFVQSGNFASGNSTVQVTDGVNTLDVRINGSTNIDGTAIPAGTISIYGLMSQFNASYQLIPRDLNDIVPYVAPDKEINLLISGATALTGSTHFIGTSASVNLEIENLGINNLTISGASFSGPNAGDFAHSIVNGPIAGGGSQTFTVNVTPTTAGSMFATLTITSDDPDEGAYILNFEAVGTSGLATEPTSNPSNLVFTQNTAYKVSGQYTAGSGATKYVVLWKNGSAPTGMPVDGTSYSRGDVIGDAKVAYIGTATGFTPRGVIANQNYHFAIYGFNGQGGFENYLTTAPLSGNVTSGGSTVGTYYNGISEANPSFISDLTALINPHQFISYFNYKQTMMNEFELKDTTGGNSFVTCAYSGDRTVFTGAFDWQTADYSREHVFAHSWMPTFPADSPEEPEYTDLHNLHPVQFSQVNAVRSNYPLGEVVTVQSSYLGSKIGLNALGQKVFEPRDDMKGNAARALMYMSVCYNGQSGIWPFPSQISFTILYGQDQNIIKQWHEQDPPDNYEIARNEYVKSVQNNRNPFIDNPDYACYINFANMTYDVNACELNVSQQTNDNLIIYPIPANDEVFVQVTDATINAYQIIDLQGRVVESQKDLATLALKLNTTNFASGTYFVNVSTTKGTAQRKIIIE